VFSLYEEFREVKGPDPELEILTACSDVSRVALDGSDSSIVAFEDCLEFC